MTPPELDCLAPHGAPTRPIHSMRPGTLDSALAGLAPEQAAFLRGGGFVAKAGQLMLLPGPDGVAGAVLGLGEDQSPHAHGGLARGLPAGGAWRLEPGPFDMAGAVLGFCLGAYRFTARTGGKPALALLAGAEPFAAELAMARAVWFARDLINRRPICWARASWPRWRWSCRKRFGGVAGLIEGAELARDYPTVAAVGAGSDRAPAVARFAWHGSRAAATRR